MQPFIKRLFVSLLFVFSASTLLAQSYQRQQAETPTQFIQRITKIEELPHPVIETKEWDSTRKVIIYFVPDVEDDEENVIGYMLVPTGNLSYQRVLIDTFYEEGGTTKIETLFFANADKDQEREIVILTSWLQIHRGAGIDGVLYGTYIYDTPDLLKPQKQLTFYKELSEKLDGGFEGDQEGKSVKAKYKTVASIRDALKKLGY